MNIASDPGDQAFTCPNNQDDIQKLVYRLRKINPQIILLQTTSGYEFLIVAVLREANLPACFINPKLVRNFARFTGIVAKTNRLDAKVLALFASRMQLQPRSLPEAKQQELKLLMTRQRQLLDMLRYGKKPPGPHSFTSDQPQHQA